MPKGTQHQTLKITNTWSLTLHHDQIMLLSPPLECSVVQAIILISLHSTESLTSSSIAESSHRPSKTRSNNTVVNPDPDSNLDELYLIPEQSPSSIRATQVTYQEKRQSEAQAVATFHGTSAKRFRQRKQYLTRINNNYHQNITKYSKYTKSNKYKASHQRQLNKAMNALSNNFLTYAMNLKFTTRSNKHHSD
ncbi:hypothetical protein C1646_760011 [Rhizophagus diaphanus]|nr:hypothetical protein C1646_760011 [Rhizophagus diaphanus] [Rhizophagus sp. MUCL 43196]